MYGIYNYIYMGEKEVLVLGNGYDLNDSRRV